MQIFGISGADALAWLLAAAFCGAGLYNAFGPSSVRDGFVRWGYPAWWSFVTGGLEVLAAALIVLPPTRIFGLALAGLVCAAAIATVVRHRDYGHLPPGLVLIVIVGADLALMGI